MLSGFYRFYFRFNMRHNSNLNGIVCDIYSVHFEQKCVTVIAFFVRVSKYYARLMGIEQERNWVEQYIGDNEWETEIGSRRPIIIRRVALNCWLPFCSFIDRGRILIGVRKFIHNSVIKCTHARKLQWKLAPAEESRLQQRWICIKCRSTALHSSGLVHRKSMYIYICDV